MASSSHQETPSTAWEYVKTAIPHISKALIPSHHAPNSLTEALGRLPPVNSLVYNPSRRRRCHVFSHEQPIRHHRLKALLVQATGRPSSKDEVCFKCAKGHGLWIGCIRAPAEYADAFTQDACANCIYGGEEPCRPVPARYSFLLDVSDIPTAGSISSTAIGSNLSLGMGCKRQRDGTLVQKGKGRDVETQFPVAKSLPSSDDLSHAKTEENASLDGFDQLVQPQNYPEVSQSGEVGTQSDMSPAVGTAHHPRSTRPRRAVAQTPILQTQESCEDEVEDEHSMMLDGSGEESEYKPVAFEGSQDESESEGEELGAYLDLDSTVPKPIGPGAAPVELLRPIVSPMAIQEDPETFLLACPVIDCENVYESRSGLAHHMKHGKHSTEGNKKEKPLKCPVMRCEMSYTYQRNLKHHIRTRHPTQQLHSTEANKEKPLKCPVMGCEKSYKETWGLEYHIQTRHSTQQLHNNGDGSTAQNEVYEVSERSTSVQPERSSVQDTENSSDTLGTSKLENNVIIPLLDAHSRWDLEIAGGKVVSRILSAANSPPSLLLPSLCHPHIHLDKPYILNCHHPSSETYPNYDDLAPQSGSFQEALTNTASAKARYTPEDLYLRGSQLLAESCGRHGVTAARTFVEVDHVVEFKTLETAIRLKKDFEHLIEIQICLFAQDPIFSTEHGEENRRLLLEAIDRFGDHIGALGTTPYVEQGADAAKKARAEIKNIEWAIDTAIEKGLHLDFHLDYNLDDTKQSSVFKVISRLRDYDWPSNAQPGKTIVIGHCTQLTTRNDELDRLRALINEAPTLPIHFVGLPTSDLFMMGRPEARANGQGTDYMPHARPRGTMQIPSMIKDFGLNGCLGVNNVGNAFTPYGNGDPLQLACWGTGIYQASAVGDPELLYECVSVRAKRAIGLMPAPSEDQEGEAENDDVPLPGLLIRNFEDIELPGRDGGKLTVPARQRLSVRDVVWDPPDTNGTRRVLI